ncbi:MAG: hypothetical protein HYX24_05145 [Candidatus Aenigmarchaeota archaeon]|nr:hypothetical protein [Candidatus Aenigmarchaeota archaeon]
MPSAFPVEIYLVLGAGIILFFFISKTLEHFNRAFLFGIGALSLPFIANSMGHSLPTDAPALMAYMTGGVSIYLAFSSIYRGLKIANLILKPFKKLFKDVPSKAIRKVK